MKINHTNLLSFERIRAFRRDYFLRLLSAFVCVVVLLILAQAALLLPSYLYASERAQMYRTQLAEIERANASGEAGGVAARFAALNEGATRALALSQSPSASAALRSILALPRPGITVNRFAVSAPGATDPAGLITVSGIALTRDALRAYHLALGSLSFVESADLPLGSYAAERDIPFMVTLKGSFTP